MTEQQGAALIEAVESVSVTVSDILEYQIQMQNLLTGIICFLGVICGMLLLSILIKQVKP